MSELPPIVIRTVFLILARMLTYLAALSGTVAVAAVGFIVMLRRIRRRVLASLATGRQETKTRYMRIIREKWRLSIAFTRAS